MSELDTRELTGSSAQALDAPGFDRTNEPASQSLDAQGRADGAVVASSPFEVLDTGDAFGVCDLDGACY